MGCDSGGEGAAMMAVRVAVRVEWKGTATVEHRERKEMGLFSHILRFV